jgi:hypothetical protein
MKNIFICTLPNRLTVLIQHSHSINRAENVMVKNYVIKNLESPRARKKYESNLLRSTMAKFRSFPSISLATKKQTGCAEDLEGPIISNFTTQITTGVH